MYDIKARHLTFRFKSGDFFFIQYKHMKTRIKTIDVFAFQLLQLLNDCFFYTNTNTLISARIHMYICGNKSVVNYIRVSENHPR